MTAVIAESDETAEYISEVWGILRMPIACTQCGKPTRTPAYWYGDRHQPTAPICGVCFRISIYGH